MSLLDRTPPGKGRVQDAADADLLTEVQQLRRDNARLTEREKSLVSENRTLRADLAALTEKYTALNDKYTGLSDKLTTVIDDVTALKTKNTAIEDSLNKVTGKYTDEDGARARAARDAQADKKRMYDFDLRLQRFERQPRKGKTQIVVRTSTIITPNDLQREACKALNVSDTTIISTEAVRPRSRSPSSPAPSAPAPSSSAATPPASSNDTRPPLHTYILTFAGHTQASQALVGGRLKRGLAASFPNNYWSCDWWLTREELQERNKLLPEKQKLHQQGVVACWRGMELWQLVQDPDGRKRWAQWLPGNRTPANPTAA